MLEIELSRTALELWLHQHATLDTIDTYFASSSERACLVNMPTGPRSPRRGAPYTFVTTEQFLVAFGLENLRDLPDREQLEDAGMSELPAVLVAISQRMGQLLIIWWC